MAGVDKVKALLRGAGFSLSTQASRKPSWFDGYVGQVSDLETGTPLFRGILAFADAPLSREIIPALRAAHKCAAEILQAERDRNAPVPGPGGQPSTRQGLGASADETPRRGPGAPRAGELVGNPWGEGPVVPVLVCGGPLPEGHKGLLTGRGLNYVDSSGAARILHKGEGATLLCVRETVDRDAAYLLEGRKATTRARPSVGPRALPKKEERVLRTLLLCSAGSTGPTLRMRETKGAGRPILLRDLADLARVSPDTAQRTLERLGADGLVEWRRRRAVKVRKHAGLLQALEASYVSRVSEQPASLCVECVDTSRVRHALATLGNGNGDPGLRAAATGKSAYMPVMDLAVYGTAGEADVSEEDPLRILVDARKHEMPAVARFLRVEPMNADERRGLPRSSCATVHLHAAYDESLLHGGGVARRGIPVVSPLQLYLDINAYPQDFGAGYERHAGYLRIEAFPSFYED